MLENKTIKFEKDKWNEFGELCDKLGYSRSKILRNIVDEKIEKLKRAIQIKMNNDR